MFTKGEWDVIGANEGHSSKQLGYTIILRGGGAVIARLVNPDRDLAEHKANAQLIAAAPELYEACKYLTNRCTEIMRGYDKGLTPDKVDWAGIVSEADRRARQAVAKVDNK